MALKRSHPANRKLIALNSDVRYVSIYQNIDIFVEYRDTILAFGCINTQFSKHGFSNLSNLIPKSNYKKLVCITFIDFFYHFLTNTSK